MRAVIQRVSQADVRWTPASAADPGPSFAAIAAGLLALVGVEHGDEPADAEWLAGKIVRLRIFPDDQGLMNRSVREVGGELLVVSQFTLLAATAHGNRPAFTRAAEPERARTLLDGLVSRLAELLGRPVSTGAFGAEMRVSLVNQGPVTICIDSRRRE